MANNPMDAIRAGWQPQAMRGGLGIDRTFDEASQKVIRSSDIVISATPITATAVTLATVPDGENWRIEHLAFHNVTAGAVSVAVFLVPDGDAPSSTDNRIYRQSVAASATVIIDGAVGYQLAPGERLIANSGSGTSFVAVGRLKRITQGEAA